MGNSNKDKAHGRRYDLERKYEDSPKQVKKREKRNAARAKLSKEGKVSKGDGKDVDHIHGVGRGNSDQNLRAISEHQNRDYPRRANHTQIRSKKKKHINPY